MGVLGGGGGGQKVLLSGIRTWSTKRLKDSPLRGALFGTRFKPMLGRPSATCLSSHPLSLAIQMGTIPCRCTLPPKETKLGVSARMRACLADCLATSFLLLSLAFDIQYAFYSTLGGSRLVCVRV